MSIYNNKIAYGVVENPIIDSPYVASLNIGSATPPPVEDFFLLLDGSNFLLLDGENLTLL
jgi:hypothetical protein